MNIFEGKTLVASASRTSSGNGDPEGLSNRDLDLFLSVTAASGVTPVLSVAVQFSIDGTTWFTPSDGTLSNATTTSSQHKRVTVAGPLCRIKWTISGASANFTFSVGAYAS